MQQFYKICLPDADALGLCFTPEYDREKLTIKILGIEAAYKAYLLRNKTEAEFVLGERLESAKITGCREVKVTNMTHTEKFNYIGATFLEDGRRKPP